MPLPDTLARFNRVVTNRLARPVARFVSPLALVVHRGRRTGRRYRTPVLAFRVGNGWAITLAYGPDRDWVRNVLEAGSCVLERGGARLELVRPHHLRGHEALRRLPLPVRVALRSVSADHISELELARRLRRGQSGHTTGEGT